jgi:hypothetical protein
MSSESSNDSWKEIDAYVKQERDAVLSMFTHLRLAVSAGVLIVILLSVSSFLVPLASYLESSDHPPATRAMLASIGLTALLVLGLVLRALTRLSRALRKAFYSEFHVRIEAIRDAAKRAEIEIPPDTDRLLNDLDVATR